MKTAALAFCLLTSAAIAQAPALIGKTSAVSGTTANIDSTGANAALVCAYEAPTNPTETVTDNAGNTYLKVVASGGAYNGQQSALYAAFGITTSSTHRFSVSNGHAFTVMLFNNLASPDQTAHNNSFSPPQPMTLTPSTASELVVMCVSGATFIGTAQDVPSSPFVAGNYAVSNLGDGSTYPNTLADAYTVTGTGTPSAITGQIDVNAGNGMSSGMASFYSVANSIPPAITIGNPLAEGTVGHTYTANPLYSICPVLSAGVQPYTVSVSGLPAGYTFDTHTGCIGGTPTGTSTDTPITFTLTDLQGRTATANSHISTASTQLTVAGGTCPQGKQLRPYSCGVMSAAGGIGTLHYASASDTSYTGLPLSLNVDPATGSISSPYLMDQGNFINVGVQATDDHGGAVLNAISLSFDGDNTFAGVKLFPDDSIYHLKVRDLPNDTSIRQKASGFYNGVPLQVGFGSDPGAGGIPVNTVPANTPFVPVLTDNGGNQFTSGPVPCTAAMEGDPNNIYLSSTRGDDDHTLVLYLPGTGADGNPHPAQLYEQYNNFPYTARNPITPGYSGPCHWANPNDPQGLGGGYGGSVLPPGGQDLQTSHGMPNGGATTDAAGLPMASELLNYDEVLGTGTPGHENGVIHHAVRMTITKMSQFWQWPGTASATQGAHDLCPIPGIASGDFQPWDQANPVTCYSGSTPILTTSQTLMPGGGIYHIPPPGSILASIALSAGGSGYTSNPDMVFSGGGCTTEPTGFGVASGGAVVDGRVATNGSGCSTAPTVTFVGGGGTGAAGTASLSVEPAACSSSALNQVFYNAMTDYGVIIADNGLSGHLIGTRDARWPDWGTLNGCLTQLHMSDLVMVNVAPTAVATDYTSSQIKPQYVVATSGTTSPLSINPAVPLPPALQGVAYSYNLPISGGTAPYSCAQTSGTLPSGITLNGATCSLSGTALAIGTAGGLIFTVTDNEGTPVTATSSSTSLTVGSASTPTAATPTFSPVAGTYISAQSVTLASATSGSTICYTVDGSTPTVNGIGTCTHGSTYSSPVAVAASLTINALASKSGYTDSDVGRAAYVISIPVTATPTCAPPAGTYTSVQSVTCSSATSSSTTYCTVDGSAPTTASPVCSSISVASTRTLKALAAAGGHLDSAVLSALYTINIPQPPTITTSSLADGMVGSVYSVTLAASGGTGPYTWAIWSGALPVGLSLSSGGVISGTPTTAGTSNVAFKVTDSLSVTANSPSMTLVVSPPVAPTVTTTTLPVGIVGSVYSATLTANAGKTPYTWAVASGTLPAGLSLSSGGVISGTPNTAGSSTLTFRVTDSLSATSVSSALTLLVNSQAVPLTISTNALPSGTSGATYTVTLVAAGGSTPYVWSVLAGTLPSGLQLDSSTGVISGTPAVAGVYSGLVFRVSDSASHIATSGALAITVAAPIPAACCGMASIGKLTSIGHVGFF